MEDPAELSISMLSLPKDVARRTRVQNDISRISDDITIQTPPTLAEVEHWLTLENNRYHIGMTKGEISCALGHLAILKRHVAQKSPFLILEDDARYFHTDIPIERLGSELCKRYDLVLFGVATKKDFLGGKRSRMFGVDVFELDRISIRYLRGAFAYTAPMVTVEKLVREQNSILHRSDSWDYFYRRGIVRRIALVDLFVHDDEGMSNLESERRMNRSNSMLRPTIKPSLLALLRGSRNLIGRANVA